MNDIVTAATWVGWYRHDCRSAWRAVVETETETAAFNRLLNAIHGGDKCILPAGVDPNQQPAAMRRRRF